MRASTDSCAEPYIYNRLATSTVTDGTRTATIASIGYDSGGVTDQPGMTMHDSAYSTSFLYRGNPTSTQKPGVSTTTSFDIGGNVTGSSTNGVYTSASNTSITNYAAPSQLTTTALNTNLSWSTFLGLSGETGPNGDAASITYDSNARPGTTYSPYGAQTTYAYNDTASPPTKTATTNGHWVRTTMDGFGRTIKTETGDGSSTKSVVDTVYDSCGCSPIGKMKQVSQPHLPNATAFYTTYSYDGLGRTLSVQSPDGASTTTYVYAGNTVTVTDPAGKWKKFTMDAFGNLVRVDEPGAATITTFYTYDVLNHLTQVAMWTLHATQYRTFNYTSGNTVGALLLSATNPENGTVNYTYNTNNLLATKTDARGTQLVYTYDGYNRLTQVSVAASVLRTFYYDTNPFDATYSQYAAGRLAAVKYGNPASPTHSYIEMYSYTQAGLPAGKRFRLTRDVQYGSGSCQTQTLTADLNASYTYNNEGKPYTITYPNGSTFTYSFDTMWRPSGLTDQNTTPWVSGVQYGPANEVQQMSIWQVGLETRQYNNLLQLTSLSTNGAPGVNIQYRYSSNQNNGKIVSQKDMLTGEEVAYQYDSLNRLISAVTTAASDQVTTPWGQGFNYDDFGNLTAKTALKGSVPQLSVAVDATTNHVVSQSYDAAGNMTTTNIGTAFYDADNRLVQVNATFYDYDPRNKRIVTNLGQPNELFFFYSVDGKNLGSYSASASQCGNPSPSLSFSAYSSPFVYFGSRRLALQDRLGSVGGYYPYGDDKSPNNPTDSFNFGTYWKDSYTGLDYADQRYYSSTLGRFMTPDPSKASAGLGDPGSWNRYAYTRGDPINRFDPGGLADFEVTAYCYGCSVFGPSILGLGVPDITFAQATAMQIQNAIAEVTNVFMAPFNKAQSYLQPAIDSALNDLKKDGCKKLFGTDASRAAGFDPAAVLKAVYSNAGSFFPQASIIAGTPVSSGFTYDFLLRGAAATTSTGLFVGSYMGRPYVGTGIRVEIGLGQWNSGGDVGAIEGMAAILLHELGHVYNALSGSGGSGIVDDKDDPNASDRNSLTIIKNCL